MMIRQLTFLLFICSFFQSYTQIIRRSIIGSISNDSLSVESIHILNKNTKKGTISNKYGMFKISVREKDTLVFDGIQFQKKEVIIAKNMIKNENMKVILIQQINELSAIEIKNINLSGELLNDAKNIKKPISKVANGTLNFSNIDFNVIDNIDAIDRQKPPDPFNNTNAKVKAGFNILGLLGYVLRPLFKKIDKIGQRKRRYKQEEKEYQKTILKVPDKIKAELGDTFFINHLKIQKEQIDDFLIYCKPKGIIDLYMNNKKIELIQVLIKESKCFKKY